MITQDRLKELLHYDPETGHFRWLVKRNGTNGINSIAGRIDTHGYVQVTIDYKSYLGHRLAWFYMTGAWPVNEVDHENLVRNNNKWSNLRPSDDSKNGANRSKYSNNTSGYKGVSLNKKTGKWTASVRINNNQIHLGTFINPQDAAKAYEEAAAKYHGEFARTE